MLTRRYLGVIAKLLSETRFRILNGVFSIDVMSVVVQGEEDTVRSPLLRDNQVWLRSRYTTFPVCGCMFGLCKRPGNPKRYCHEVCSDSNW